MQNTQVNSLKYKTLVAFGAYLIVAGFLGYLSNPEKAATALYSGGIFGLCSIGAGLLLRKSIRGALPFGIGLTLLLALAFTWRSSVGWIAVFNGQSEKTFAATLISSMLLASIVTIGILFRRK